MIKALGIGGVFFRSNDPISLTARYHKHLGVDPVPTSPDMTPWITEQGATVFSPFEADTDYFPEDRAFMLNFRVENLDAAIAELNAEGVEAGDPSTMEGVGRIARIHDPEGNPIELWEPTMP